MNAAKKGIILFLWLVVMTVATASAFVPSTSENRVWQKIASGAELRPFTALQIAELQWDEKPFRLKLALDQTYPVNGLDPDGRCIEGASAAFAGAPSPGNSSGAFDFGYDAASRLQALGQGSEEGAAIYANTWTLGSISGLNNYANSLQGSQYDDSRAFSAISMGSFALAGGGALLNAFPAATVGAFSTMAANPGLTAVAGGFAFGALGTLNDGGSLSDAAFNGVILAGLTWAANPSPLTFTSPATASQPATTYSITLNRQNGLTFQQQVTSALGATPTGPMTGTTLAGAPYTTVPDGQLPGGGPLLEVKNRQYVSYSPQLQAQVSIGQASGGPGNVLVVNPQSTVSQPTITAFGHTPQNPTIFTFDPATSTFSPY